MVAGQQQLRGIDHGRQEPPPARPGSDAAALLVLIALAVALLRQGAYHRPVAAVVVGITAAAGGVLVLQRRRWPGGTPAAAGLGALAAAAVVTGVVDGHPGGLLGPVALIAAAVVTATVTASADDDARRQLWDGLSVLGAVVGLSGVLGVALRIEPLASVAGGLWRAATTVTYANASAAILVVLALGALARLTVAPTAAGRLIATILLAGLAATLCRAGLATLCLGLVGLAVLLGTRRVVAASARPALGAAIALGGLLPGMPAAHPDRPVPAFVGLAVGLVLAAAPWPQRWSRTVVRAALSRRWLLPGTAVLVAAAVAVGLLASHSSVLSGNSVLSGKSVLSGNSVWSGRVGLSSPDRTGVAAAALQVWRDHLVTGVGPGRGLFIWTEPDHLRVFDRYAHDEYLQLAAEEGFVGLAGLVLAVGGTVVVVRRGLRHVASGRSRPSAARACCAGAAAGLLAFGAHSALDFLWHVPGVVLVAAVALGLASPRPTSGPGAGEQPVTTTTKELL